MASRAVLVLSILCGCGSGGGFPDAKPKGDANDPPPGTFRVAWSLVDLQNNTIDCAKVSAISVTGTMRSPEIAGGSTQVFSCQSGNGASQSIIPGNWAIDWDLSCGLGTISTAPRTEVLIESGKAADLAPLTFQVDTTGGLALHFNTNKAGGTCGPTASGGGGITGTTITLVHAPGGVCEPVTLAIAAGATRPASSYVVDCTTPVDAGCIENDQAITASGLASGAYQIHIRGSQAAASCWTNDDMFSVPPAGKVLTRTLNLGFATGTPGCTP
ncbi:MAG: hypothetical protein NT062_24280 [Proteobacteria bacterium]|nr:hypothetical protein [Pseudomonadota bacterium]